MKAPAKTSKPAIVGAQSAKAPNSRRVAKVPRVLSGVGKRERASEPAEFKSSVLTIRVKEQLKRDATGILAEIGISLPEAVRVFLSRVVSEKGFPFRLEVPNASTRAAMAEARHLTGRFKAAEELFDGLEKGGKS